MEFEKCRGILLQECDLVREIGGLQDVVYRAIADRDWAEMESLFQTLDSLGDRLAALESERERLFSQWVSNAAPVSGTEASSLFYAYAVRLPQEQRRELTDTYRSLKMETLKVRAAGEAIMGYIAAARATMAGFFEAAFPARAGKTYSPMGTQVSHDMRSMVLNHSY